MNNKISIWLRSLSYKQMSTVGCPNTLTIGSLGNSNLYPNHHIGSAGAIGDVKSASYIGHLITGSIGRHRTANISMFSESMLGSSQVGDVG